jgi:spore coat polysaccharide biosynthesis protein SpsF
MKIVGTIEARMGSSRLPKKTLMKIYKDFTLLELVVKRFKLCKNIDDIIVATTIEKQDDKIALWCEQNNIAYYRGSEENVLDRVTNASIQANADVIVQMGADSAYLDFELIDELLEVYKNGSYDYVCNDMELTYPLGIYGHIVKVEKLIELNKKDNLSIEDREDVVRYIWEHPTEYNILNIKAPKNKNYPDLRLTVDYPEDFELAMNIYSHFNKIDFTSTDIIDLYKNDKKLFEGVSKLVQHSAPFIKED